VVVRGATLAMGGRGGVRGMGETFHRRDR
jgi:hypothetical protein